MHQCEKDENVLLDRHSELQFDREEGVETEKGEGEVEINEALPGKDEELQRERCEEGKFENN